MSKKARRKHNPIKRYEAAARASLKGLLVVFVAGQGDGMAQLVSRSTRKPVRCSQSMADALGQCQYKWNVVCAITCRRRHDGQEYMQSEAFKFEQPYRQSHLAPWLNERHKKLLKESNPAHRVTAAWIGCPGGHEISDELASEVLTNLGAWEFKADWECAE